MSGYKGHIIFSFIIIALAFTVGYFLDYISLDILNQPVLYWSVGVIVLFSILPDIDTPASMSSTLFSLATGASGAYFMYTYLNTNDIYLLYIAIALFILLFLKVFLKHRGAAHSLIMALILVSPFGIMYYSTGEFFWLLLLITAVLSFGSHLLLDQF